MKGETSGNRLRIHAIAADCDRDSLLLVADPEGPTCHLGTDSCFGAAGPFFPAGLEQIVLDRSVADPAESYTARLLAAGAKRLAQKVGEEGLEVALAAVGGDRDELIGEVADLAFHLTVMMSERGVGWREVGAELERRHRDNIARASS
jgi:phosphoribosyl-ATP pyrophosphohydrolase/phosphoribosyl-AMP cyclohydrolase